jgi:hypothetical protein
VQKLQSPAEAINPAGIYPYIDVVRGFLREPLTKEEIAWVFSSRSDKDAAFEFLCRHFVKKNHGDQEIRFVGEEDKITRYSGPRSAPNVSVIYADKGSKVTGEDCVHIDWRINGGAALRRAGIHSLRDLLDLDYRQFWGKRLKISSLNLRSLGRMHCNRNNLIKRRGPWVQYYCNGRFTYDVHLRIGSTIARAYQSTQAVIDRYRKDFEVNRCVITHEVPHLLPPMRQVLPHDYPNNHDLRIVSHCKSSIFIA